MQRYVVVATMLFVAGIGSSAAQEAQPDAQKAQPNTKLEAFSARTGIVLIKAFSNVGIINGLGRVSIDARELRDAGNPKQPQYGVTIEVKETGRLERESISYIDEDEIDSLIKGLEYISKIDKSVSSLNNFEAQYRTKGDFSVTVFSSRGGDIRMAVSSGRIGRTSAYLKLSDAQELKNALLEAKKLIASARVALKQ